MLDFDDAASRRVEQTYGTPDIVSQRRATIAALDLVPGERVELIPMIAAFVPGRAGVTEPEARAWADELRGLGGHPFFSLCRYHFVARAGRS